MKKYGLVILLLAGIVGSFALGVSTGYNRHFPFRLLKKYWSGPNVDPSFHNVGRNLHLDRYTSAETDPLKQTGVYLTYGQSNAENGGQYGYSVRSEVYQFALGETFVYEDPSIGGIGQGGSVWGMLGDKLIERGFHEQVVFANCAWGGIRISKLKEGHYLQYLIDHYNGLMKKFGRVDGVLFHQGEADNFTEGVLEYYDNYVVFLENLDKAGIRIPVYLSRASLCGEGQPLNKDLTDIQDQIIADFEMVKEGPNTDMIIAKGDRIKDNCHFTLSGYDKFAEMWVKCLVQEK